jgi:hypothetical protein
VRPERRVLLTWFAAGIAVPPALYGFGTIAVAFGLAEVGRLFQLIALGACPFWLFLWLPAMSQPNNAVLFFICTVAVLLANGCLYLVMAKLQSNLVRWRWKWRIVTLSIAYPVLMAVAYCLPLALDAL